MCSAVFVSSPLAAENVSAGCVGWGKYAQIRAKDTETFSATLRAHLCFDYLWEFDETTIFKEKNRTSVNFQDKSTDFSQNYQQL